MALRYQREVQYFSYLQVRGIFFKDFHEQVATVESISPILVQKLKRNKTAMISTYIQNDFSSMKLRLLGRLRRFLLVNLLPFALNIIKNYPFSSPVMIFLRIFLRPEQRLVAMNMQSSLYLSVGWLVGWLLGFTAYQPFSDHLTLN